MRVLGAVLSLAALVGILAAQVNAARGAFSIIGLEGPEAAVVATLVFIAYTAFGGLWAAVLSDVVQIAIAGVGVVIAGGVVLDRAGGLDGLQEALAAKDVGEGYLTLTGAGPTLILWLLLPTVMYTLIGQDFYQRLFAAKSAEVARRAAFFGGLFLIAISFFPAVIGIGARALSDIDDKTQAVPWVLQNLLGPLLGGIILAAILAAIMSTADSLLTSATSHLVKDLWIETLGHDAGDEQRLLRISRVSTVLVGLLALAIGLATPGIVTLLIYSYTLYTAGVFVPVLGGVLWRRGHPGRGARGDDRRLAGGPRGHPRRRRSRRRADRDLRRPGLGGAVRRGVAADGEGVSGGYGIAASCFEHPLRPHPDPPVVGQVAPHDAALAVDQEGGRAGDVVAHAAPGWRTP